jgi:nucleotide-binding universal stress UspA family protein
MAAPILLATDLSSRCDRALDRAALLARAWNVKLVVVHAITSPTPVVDEPSWRRRLSPEQRAARRIRDDLDALPPMPVDVVIEQVEPSQLIVETASQKHCGLIVTGVARKEVLGATRLSPLVEHLARHSPIPVLVVRSRARVPYRNVVVSTDFSDASRTALVTALEMFPDANIRLIHAFQVVFESHFADKMAAREATQRGTLEEAAEFLEQVPEAAGRDVEVLCEYGDPDAVLSDLVETTRTDLSVIGTTGRGWLGEWLLGSTALQILSVLEGDVLVVPRG